MTERVEVPLSRPTHPLLFALGVLPFGAAVGFLQVAVPYRLSLAGVSLAAIATLSSVAFLPHTVKIFWVPLIDLLGRRRIWFLCAANATAVLLGLASLLRDPAHQLPLLTGVLILAQAAAATSSAALEALMATTTLPEHKGTAGGYYMAGNIGGTGLIGALAIWLASHVSPTAAGLILAVIVSVASLVAMGIHEPQETTRPAAWRASAWASLSHRARELGADLWQLLKSREGVTGLILCAAPVGCGALTNLFSGMQSEFHASEGLVALVSGLGAGLAGGLGSLMGGYWADRMNRRLAYVMAGALTALSAVAMALAPTSSATFTWGVLAYGFANGIAFAAFAGMVLEVVSSGVAVTTKYILFVAVSNLAIAYATWMDGQGAEFHHLGARGALWFDVGLTFLGITVVGAMALVVRRRMAKEASARAAA